MDARAHWQNVYQTRQPDEVSWYRPHLETSLALIESAAPDRGARVIDVGGGASTLVDDLTSLGYREVAVLDVSSAALDIAKDRLGANRAASIDWLCGDVTSLSLPTHRYDLWHDRAVFHFLTRPAERAAYVRQVLHATKPGGRVIVATFAPNGPQKCSGLDVARYDPDALHAALGSAFRLERQLADAHRTPAGAIQAFTVCDFRIVRTEGQAAS